MEHAHMIQRRHRHAFSPPVRDDITDNSRTCEHRCRSRSVRRCRIMKQNEGLLMRCRALPNGRGEPLDLPTVAARNTIETVPRAMKPDLPQIL
jgi:hypothetical protein